MEMGTFEGMGGGTIGTDTDTVEAGQEAVVTVGSSGSSLSHWP